MVVRERPTGEPLARTPLGRGQGVLRQAVLLGELLLDLQGCPQRQPPLRLQLRKREGLGVVAERALASLAAPLEVRLLGGQEQVGVEGGEASRGELAPLPIRLQLALVVAVGVGEVPVQAELPVQPAQLVANRPHGLYGLHHRLAGLLLTLLHLGEGPLHLLEPQRPIVWRPRVRRQLLLCCRNGLGLFLEPRVVLGQLLPQGLPLLPEFVDPDLVHAHLPLQLPGGDPGLFIQALFVQQVLLVPLQRSLGAFLRFLHRGQPLRRLLEQHEPFLREHLFLRVREPLLLLELLRLLILRWLVFSGRLQVVAQITLRKLEPVVCHPKLARVRIQIPARLLVVRNL
mmetsp:Transcript_41467/g.107929  ORF Transcript_41467/g.107929 Transcript_41467/m.107929 type:complete len:343 (-) Transcript_41467:851-1879(-)